MISPLLTVICLMIYQFGLYTFEKSHYKMVGKEINLFELANAPHGLLIFPLLLNSKFEEELSAAYEPHRHDYYSLFLITGGHIKIIVDSYALNLTSSSLLLICPEQVHQLLHLEEISGWVLSFDTKYLDKKARLKIDSHDQKIKIFNLNRSDQCFLENIIKSIDFCAKDTAQGLFKTQTIQALVNVLFYKIVNIFDATDILIGERVESRNCEILYSLKTLVKKHFFTLKKPSDYASLMHLSTNYLNDVIKRATGYSTSYIIQQEIIGEAQRQLLYTPKTIKEIGTFLGYNDYKYFIRLFKKVVKKSPTHYRGNQNEEILKFQ